jgi:hypothetical protein
MQIYITSDQKWVVHFTYALLDYHSIESIWKAHIYVSMIGIDMC